MTTTYDTDPNTATVAAAWASSPLGQPDREVGYDFATPDSAESVEPRPVTKRAILAAALASGVIGGAVLGVALFNFSDSSQPMVVEQGPVPGHAVVVGPSTAAPAPTQSVQGPAFMPSTQHVPGSAGVATPPTGVATPPAPSESPVVVDIPTPENSPLPPKSEEPAPKPEDPPAEPPNPVPPVPDDLDFKLPEPQPDPEPVPPVFQPDLPLAPAPAPKPQPPSLPDLPLQAPVKS